MACHTWRTDRFNSQDGNKKGDNHNEGGRKDGTSEAGGARSARTKHADAPPEASAEDKPRRSKMGPTPARYNGARNNGDNGGDGGGGGGPHTAEETLLWHRCSRSKMERERQDLASR